MIKDSSIPQGEWKFQRVDRGGIFWDRMMLLCCIPFRNFGKIKGEAWDCLGNQYEL